MIEKEQNFIDCLVGLLDTGYSIKIDDNTITITYLDEEEHLVELYYKADQLNTKEEHMLPQSMFELLKLGAVLKKERGERE